MNGSFAPFSRLHIKGFRRLLDVDMELRPVMVLIGANGVGKTSLLDAWSLLAHSAGGKLNAWLSEAGGIGSQITYDHADALDFEISMPIENYNPLVYRLQMKSLGILYTIPEETLTQHRQQYQTTPFYAINSRGTNVRYFNPETNRLEQPSWAHNPQETSLAQVPKMFNTPEEFRQKLASTTLYHVLNVHSRAPVRLPQTMRPAALPGANGEDLASCLYYLRETNRDRFDAVMDSLHSSFGTFERLDFPPVAAGTITMTWKDRNFTHPLYLSQWSEGMLRFVWLQTLLQSPGLTQVTMIDEPEVSLHPELLAHLVDVIREASQRTQVIVATHADRLIRFLQPHEVCVLEMDEGGMTRAVWGDQMDLDEWLKDYALDELWRMGRMGGRA